MNSYLLCSKYEIIAKIGEGGFGIVYKAREIGTTNIVTIKQIKQKEWPTDEDIPLNILREIQILDNLKGNAKIINLRDVIVDKFTKSVYIIYEYYEHDINNLIRQKKSMTVRQIKSYMKQMIIALQTIHSKGFIHCDIKPNNFIISADNEIKLIDFGVSQKIDNKFKFPGMGTNSYNAPELILGNTEYEIEIDIWSLGCTFYEMMTKERLIHHCYSNAEIANQMIQIFDYPNKNDFSQFLSYPNCDLFIKGSRYSDISVNEFFDIKLPNKFKCFKKLLLSMLQMNPKNRISLEDALNDSALVDAESSDNLPLIDVAECNRKNFTKCVNFGTIISNEILDELRPIKIVPIENF